MTDPGIEMLTATGTPAVPGIARGTETEIANARAESLQGEGREAEIETGIGGAVVDAAIETEADVAIATAIAEAEAEAGTTTAPDVIVAARISTVIADFLMAG